MERLHIPLSRNVQTTRRTRWVVWLLGLFVIGVLYGAYWISTIWFTRDAIYRAAPEGTQIAFRFFVGGSKLDAVAKTLANIPLVSNRTITIDDLKPYLQSEFVIFFNEQGDQSVAIRLKTPLPQSILDAEQIVQKQINSRLVLLSENPKTLLPLPLKPKRFVPFPWPRRSWIGEIAVIDQSKRGFIFDTNTHVNFSFPWSMKSTEVISRVPNETIAYLSIGESSVFGALNEIILAVSPFISTVLNPSTLEMMKQIPSSKGLVILTTDKDGIGFYLVSKSDQVKVVDKKQFLQSIMALNHPKIQKTLLSDGSLMQEIILDSDAFSVEQITILGLPVYRMGSEKNKFLTNTNGTSEFVLSNREDLIRFFRENNSESEDYLICGGSIVGIKLKQLANLLMQNDEFTNFSIMNLLSERFSSIGVVNNLYSTDIRLCK